MKDEGDARATEEDGKRKGHELVREVSPTRNDLVDGWPTVVPGDDSAVG